jgi:hypothetical protein
LFIGHIKIRVAHIKLAGCNTKASDISDTINTLTLLVRSPQIACDGI